MIIMGMGDQQGFGARQLQLLGGVREAAAVGQGDEVAQLGAFLGTGSGAGSFFLRFFSMTSSLGTACASQKMPRSLTRPKLSTSAGSPVPKVTVSVSGSAMCITAASSRFRMRTVWSPKMRALSLAYAAMSPCQSRWSCDRFKTVAASACRLNVVCSWKLDNSSIHACGKVLATAGGERLKHEETGFKEIAIFKTGVTL